MVTSEGEDEAVLPSQLTEWSMPIFLEPLSPGNTVRRRQWQKPQVILRHPHKLCEIQAS